MKHLAGQTCSSRPLGILCTFETDLTFTELEISAVVHINNNNNNQPLDALEKRKSFADMKMAKVTNQNLHSIEVFIIIIVEKT